DPAMAGLEERDRAAVRPGILRVNHIVRLPDPGRGVRPHGQGGPTKHPGPLPGRRSLFVLLHSFFPYLLEKVLVSLENELEGGGRGRAAGPVLEPGGLAEEGVQRALTLLQRLHVALFYLSGSFYHLSKRAAAITYGDDSTIRSSYRLLGALSLLQSLITVSLQLNNYRKKQRARQEWQLHRKTSDEYCEFPGDESRDLLWFHVVDIKGTARSWNSACPQHTHSGGAPQGASCMLCLEERRHSTSTPCGHLFCWEVHYRVVRHQGGVPPVSGEVRAPQTGVPEELQLAHRLVH
ncbi:hypothetical protein KUCAC02_012950, partial [Chaenocephalus aceratus]